MTDVEYGLRWPRNLFEWEARQILALDDRDDFEDMVEHLLREAYQDPEVSALFARKHPRAYSGWGAKSGNDQSESKEWLRELLRDETRLRAYTPPVYWLERQGGAREVTEDSASSLNNAFIALITELADSGYFPKVLPVVGRDEEAPTDVETTSVIQRATKVPITWPLDAAQLDRLPHGASYSLIEFFHHQAQRPRKSYYEEWIGGFVYSDFNKNPGGVVYRWRLNALLERFAIPLRLGASGEERGRLIRQFETPLNLLVEEQAIKRGSDPEDEVGHAIRMFRARDATLGQKRGALALMIGDLEPRRKRVDRLISKQDASDLFNIANRFTIRHRDKSQRADFGEEFLDWIFWTYLATIGLMDEIELKAQAQREARPSDSPRVEGA